MMSATDYRCINNFLTSILIILCYTSVVASLSAPNTSSSAASCTSTTSRPFVTFYHPVTHTKVTLIGCLHGSASSAKDVSDILYQEPTDVVVLELCPTRYKDLRREFTQRRNDRENRITGGYLTMIQKTIEARGLSTGLAAAVLGGVSSLSYFLSGFQPGYEFLTAMEYVDSRQHKCDVVLADQLVDETLRQVGALPTVSIEMLETFVRSGFDWEKTYGLEMEILWNALSGQGDLQVDLKRTLFRNTDVIIDVTRLTLPTILFVQVANFFLGMIFQGWIYPTMNDQKSIIEWVTWLFDLSSMANWSDWSTLLGGIALEWIPSAMALYLGFLLVALPTSKIILSERDEQLARGIDVACQIAAEKNDHDRGRVVAVLGLLHVNGVARRILLQSENDQR